MKGFAKILGGLAIVVALCVVAIIALVEFQSRRSQRQVVAMVTRFSPGTPFSVALQFLGQPAQTFTNGEKTISWLSNVGSRVDPDFATNSLLHTFTHLGPPFRYILIYTDRHSQKVTRADWCSM